MTCSRVPRISCSTRARPHRLPLATSIADAETPRMNSGVAWNASHTVSLISAARMACASCQTVFNTTERRKTLGEQCPQVDSRFRL